jgi:cytoskeletal protein CcmA (bactofilin family)
MFESHDQHAQEIGSGAALSDHMTQAVSALLGEEAAREMTALVGVNTEFRGVIHYNGTVRIDGRVEGEIHTEGVLLIGKDAVIRATVSAGTIVSCGTIFGDVTATEKITLLKPAVLQGSIKTPLLSMEEGVRFKGNLKVPETGEEDRVLQSVTDREVAVVANS